MSTTSFYHLSVVRFSLFFFFKQKTAYDFFFCKQKTAYELSTRDWSSDVALPISVLDVECGAHVLSASAAASAAAGQHHFSSGAEVLGTAATLAGERELGRARGEQAVDRKGEPKAPPRSDRKSVV